MLVSNTTVKIDRVENAGLARLIEADRDDGELKRVLVRMMPG